MRKTTRYARTGVLPAIAAVLALSSTSGLAQQAQPAPTDPTTVPATTAPATTAPSTTVPEQPAPAAQPAAPPTASSASDTTVSTAKTRSAPTPAHLVRRSSSAAKPARSVTHSSGAGRAATASKAAPPAAPAAAPPPPAAAMAAKPAVPRAAKPGDSGNDPAFEIGGAAAAVLALAIAFAAARRRKHEDEEQWFEDQSYEEAYEEPVAAETETAPMPRHDALAKEQPATFDSEASAFSWGAANDSSRSSTDGSDRRPGETWVERAYRGPSPANPSVSLRNRLRRAAFFDKREREVAEGRAVAVEPAAGLPGTRGEKEESERELA